MTTEPITLSNSIRLTARQWLAAALLVVPFALLASPLWQFLEDFPLEPDYRVPREFKQDYWLYQRFSHLAATDYDSFVVGDSVVWGFFSKRPETLPHYLNKQAGGERFANFGMIGAHPLALEGLVRHYAGGITDKKVLLQCNLLWLKSPKEDLQVRDPDRTAEVVFHAGLIPQFVPNVPAYNQDMSRRLSILVEQRLSISQLANHWQQAYYGRQSIPAWTTQHPYDNPVSPLLQGLPPSDNSLERLQIPWFKDSRSKEDAPWLDMETSLQWPAFQRVVKLLQGRNNRVFVVVGPFNEHMLTPVSKQRCQTVKGIIGEWLKANDIPHMIAEVLPSEEYADLSHPLPGGYERLAERLRANAEFLNTMK